MARDPDEKICLLCKKTMVKQKTDFTYLGHSFHTDVLRCPDCGQVYIPEDLVNSRMKEVETLLEDK